jgi:hypothetical protein
MRAFYGVQVSRMESERFSALISSDERAPIRWLSRFRGTATSLSTIIRHDARSPLVAFGSTGSLKIGAEVGSVVSGQTMMESVASNRLSWTTTAGRGLPAYAAPSVRPDELRSISV